MDNPDKRTHSSADSGAPVEVVVYVLESSFHQVYNAFGGDTVEDVIVTSVCRRCSTPPATKEVLSPEGMSWRLLDELMPKETSSVALVSSLVTRPDFGDEALTILVPLQDRPNLLYDVRIKKENRNLIKKNKEARAYHILLVTARYSVLTPAPEFHLDALREEVDNLPSQLEESQAVGLFFLTLVHHLINCELLGDPEAASLSGQPASLSGKTASLSGQTAHP